MKKILLLLLLLVFLGIVASIGYQKWTATHHSDYIELYGNIDVRQVDLSFRVSGRINALLFEEGDLIKSGDLVATLDEQPYIDQVREAEAAVEVAQVNFENGEKLFQRRQELIGEGGVSQEDLDNALAQQKVYDATRKQAEASLGVALTNLQDTKVFSPSEGVLLTRIREPGTVVKPADPVITISLITPVWVRAFIPEPLLGTIHPGMRGEIFTDTENGKVYQGHVGFISPVAEFTPKTVETTELRTDLVYRIRLIAENPDNGLRQGMPVTIRLKPQSE